MTRITDEMIEAMESTYMDWHIAHPDTTPAQVKPDMRLLITAAYPLIRKQVLEEAAAVCEAMKHSAHPHYGHAHPSIAVSIAVQRTTVGECAQAIRNMAKEG